MSTTNEKTPLVSEAAQKKVKDMVSNVMNNEKVEAVAIIAQNKLQEIKTAMSNEGHFSLRLLSFLGGIGIIFVSAYEFFPKLLTFNWLGALIEIYIICLGILVLLMEGKELRVPSSILSKLHKYALFLRFMWGRGMLYFVAGSLLLTQFGLIDLIVGGYMCFVGVLYIVTGYRTAEKIKETSGTFFSKQTLRQKFDEVDVDGTGLLSLEQFSMLLQSLGVGVNFTTHEIEAAFIYLDKSQSGALNFQDVQEWWVDTSSSRTDNIPVVL